MIVLSPITSLKKTTLFDNSASTLQGLLPLLFAGTGRCVSLDVLQLYKAYISAADPPPVDMIRSPQFLGRTLDFLELFQSVFVHHQSAFILLCHLR